MAIPSLYYGDRNSMLGPSTAHRAVTPNDSTDLPDGPCRALNCSTSGTITIIGVDDTVAVAITVGPGNNAHAVKRVLATGTDSMDIVALY